jgi:pentatricopeptide repeat protein
MTTLAENVFDEMRETGIEPDVMSFSTVLHVYSRENKPELTVYKLKLMKEKGICSTVAKCALVVKCLCSFEMNDMGLLHNFFNIKVYQDDGGVFIC